MTRIIIKEEDLSSQVDITNPKSVIEYLIPNATIEYYGKSSGLVNNEDIESGQDNELINKLKSLGFEETETYGSNPPFEYRHSETDYVIAFDTSDCCDVKDLGSPSCPCSDYDPIEYGFSKDNKVCGEYFGLWFDRA